MIVSLRKRKVTRFKQRATKAEKREFAKKLVEALDEAGVWYEHAFYVVSAIELEGYMEDVDMEIASAQEDAERSAAETNDIAQLVHDYNLGIVDRDELVDKARRIRRCRLEL